MALEFNSIASFMAKLHSDHLQQQQSIINTIAIDRAKQLTDAASIVDVAEAKVGKIVQLESGGFKVSVTQTVKANPKDLRLNTYLGRREKITHPNLSELCDILNKGL